MDPSSGKVKAGADVDFYNHRDMMGHTYGKINNVIDFVKVDKVKDGTGKKCAMNDRAEITWKGYDRSGKLLFDSHTENHGKP